ncbi:MAG: ABC transporter permease [Actinobacteria bacterium]|nr:ABC transporter permease [Actinomycetota bacterium]
MRVPTSNTLVAPWQVLHREAGRVVIVLGRNVRLEQRMVAPRFAVVIVPAVSVVFALVVGGIFLAATGHPPLDTYLDLLKNGYASFYGITDTLGLATPLICTGLAAAFAFRMNLYSIGQEGQLYLGMIGGAWAGIALADSLPALLAVPLVLVFGALAGAAWVAVPALLRARLGTSEIVSTLLLNYVALNLVNYFIFGSRGFFRDPTTSFPQGRPVAESARLSPFSFFTDKVTNTYPTLLVSVVLAAFLFWFMRTSNYGYETAVYADSPNTARYAGMNSMRLQSSVLLISGAIAGVGGAMYVVGPAGKVDPGLLQIGLGYAGIVVAALARYNFLAVVIAAILFAGLRTGGNALQVSNDPVPIAIAIVLQGAVLLFALGGELFRRNRVVISRVGQAVPT